MGGELSSDEGNIPRHEGMTPLKNYGWTAASFHTKENGEKA